MQNQKYLQLDSPHQEDMAKKTVKNSMGAHILMNSKWDLLHPTTNGDSLGEAVISVHFYMKFKRIYVSIKYIEFIIKQ